MKIAFPHIGDAHLVGRIFFKEIGVEVVIPPANCMKGLEKGSEASPDEICIPFKLMINNLMEAYRMGADTAVMPATMGPCRLGEYGELLKSILDKRGYPYHWILLDSIQVIGKKEMLRRLGYLVSESGYGKPQILRSLYGTYRVLKKLELLDQRAHILAAYETKKGEVKRETAACRRELAMANSVEEALNILRRYLYFLENVQVDYNRQPIHILLTGEIFSMIEPFANHHIEELLMDMGVSFEKRITLGWWIRNTILNPFQLRTLLVRKNRYLSYAIGGYARETVEDGFISSKKGCDGVIQIFPVGCMPEIVAKAVFSKMMKDNKLSVLTVIYDEMGGEAGFITRVEAFIDMLNRKKRAEIINNGGATLVEGSGMLYSEKRETGKRRRTNALRRH